jgi:DNA-binding CsgD family transcriptional regulator
MTLHQSSTQNQKAYPAEAFPSDAYLSQPSKPLPILDSQINASLHLLAKGFSASYAIDLTGAVLAHFSAIALKTDVNTVNFQVKNGLLHTNDPMLMQYLGIALARLRRTETQYLCSDGIGTVVVLRKIPTNLGNLVLVCPRQEYQLTEEQVYEFGRIFALTKTQCEILRDLCAGTGPEEISSKREISLSTVRTHIRNLLQRTKSKDTKSLVCDVRSILTSHC